MVIRPNRAKRIFSKFPPIFSPVIMHWLQRRLDGRSLAGYVTVT